MIASPQDAARCLPSRSAARLKPITRPKERSAPSHPETALGDSSAHTSQTPPGLPNSAASSAPRLIAIRLINQAVDAELVQSLPRASRIFPCGDSKLHAPDGLSQTDRCSLMGTTGTDRGASPIGATLNSKESGTNRHTCTAESQEPGSRDPAVPASTGDSTWTQATPPLRSGGDSLLSHRRAM